MKIFYLCILLFVSKISTAGTPAMNDTTILYGIALLLLAILIGVPYLIKFFKNKYRLFKEKKEQGS